MAKGKICVIDGCCKPEKARGWCNAHWYRWYRHGDPIAGRSAWGEPERWLREVAFCYEGDECLIWPFGRITAGYGNLYFGGEWGYAHRRVCEEVNGPATTPKHEAAHSCGKGHEGCVTKKHLRWATHAENMADMLEHGTSNLGKKFRRAKPVEISLEMVQ
jgi:hypothetical protein